MNKLKGTVTRLEIEGGISLVEADVLGERFTALVLESAETAGYLAVGSRIQVQFKEAEVSIALPAPGFTVSIRNRIPCVVRSITQGKILSHLILDFHGSDMHSLISTRAVAELGLRPGLAVQALIKATEVGLAEDHGPF